MIKSYNLLKLLGCIGALWFILVVLFYPKPDQIVSFADVVFQVEHGEFFNVGDQERIKPEVEKLIQDFDNHENEKEIENEIKKEYLKVTMKTKERKEKISQFVKPPNIFYNESVGEFGEGVKMPKNVSQYIQKLYDEGWEAHQFNQYLSDLISVKRKLLDHRPDYCKQIESNYSKTLPATSVIVIFHNEAWSTLLRTVHSVLDRSPEHLIEEIILVDDFSEMGLLKIF
jgi:polypeptide N-acetylgalactosaminyltransferase